MTSSGRLHIRLVRALMAAALVWVSAACTEPTVIASYPGERWVGPDGEEVAVDRLALYASDCPAWPGAGFLEIGPDFDGEVPERRRYARDAESSLPPIELLAPYDPRAALSRDARFTGYETEDFMLFLGEDQDIYAYLVDGPRVEALPRAEPTLACP